MAKMKIQFIVFAIYMLTLAGGCNEGPPNFYLSENESQLIRDAEEIGRLIYEKDKCAARATDIILEQMPNHIIKSVRGWITCKRGEDYIVLFVLPREDGLVSLCQIVFKKRGQPQLIQQVKPLSEEEAAMFRARQHALEIVEEFCSDEYNTVVLPRNDGDGWLLYALAATTDPHIIVAGGHYRATISKDGNDILSRRRFTKSCLNIKKDPPNKSLYTEPVACVMSHLLDNIPTEIHVFLSLSCKKPFYVVTMDGRKWSVRGDTIELLK